jgi:glutamate---cysteine ligase / carboxylate-amine ligase
MSPGSALTLGVEEEFHVVDLVTRQAAPVGPRVLEGLPSNFAAELQRSVVETNSSVETSLEALRTNLIDVRRQLAGAAERVGVGVVAAGSVPLVDTGELGVTSDPRYAQMLADYQLLVREQVICGAQVHVGVPNRDHAVAVARRVSADLPVLLALSASSPYWLGTDTGYASYRTFVWSRWPTSGPFPEVKDAKAYEELIDDLISSSVITDPGMIYFDVRPSAHVPTIELRLCDSVPRVDDVLLLAGLFRALVMRAGEDEDAGRPYVATAPSLIRAAMWRAARAGLEGDLVDLREHKPLPVQQVVRRLVDDLRPQLEEAGDWDHVRALVDEALRDGSSAARQRAAFRAREQLTDVVDLLLHETGGGEHGRRPQRPKGTSLAAGYELRKGDEAIGLGRRPARDFAPVLSVFEGLGTAELETRERARDRQQTEREVTFTIDGETRPFPIDLVPRLIGQDEWAPLARGLQQRALALEAFLHDVYGARSCVRAGLVPGAMLDATPGLRPAGALVPPGAVRATVIGTDLVRDSTGIWRVLEDNLRVPSGLAYAMHARDLLATVVPELRPPPGTLPADPAADRLGHALRAAAGGGRQTVHLGVLTSGTADSAWWEHKTLADRLGADLVQPKDLVVTDGGVYRLEHGRRYRLDVLYRRLDEDLLDHVPGADGRPLGRRLLAAVRSGGVALANAPGNGVADDKAVYALVPALIRHYLGEEPLLEQVPTYLCSDPVALEQVLDRMAELVLKPVDGYGGAGVTIGPDTSAAELDSVRQQVIAAPQRWIAQDVVQLTTHPTLVGGRLEPRNVDLRAFVVLSREPEPGAPPHPEVLQAPLTRVAPSGSMIVNSSRGGGAKDTWIVPAAEGVAGVRAVR